jgi:hypothetical protein
VYGWTGETRLADGSPLFNDGDDGTTSSLFPGWICKFGPPDGATLTLPGPSGCVHRKGDAGAYIGSAIIAVATAGLLIPDPNPKGTLVPMTSGSVK